MSFGHSEMEDRVADWWRWFTMALFLLLPVDLLTTFVAIARYGTGVEANPIMKWLLSMGFVPVVVANLLVLGLAVILFDAAIDAVRNVRPEYRDEFVYGFNLWIGFVFMAGIVLTANNLLVIT